jgi:hypothetical protein
MIIKASQRSGARNLANHLANVQDNDHVTLHEVRGLAGHSLQAALLEIDAVSKGTQCYQPLFSVSFNPPQDAQVSDAQFDAAFAKFEQKLGLTDQPRVVVFHEKEGRRHCHVVWSRIDVDRMRAINMSHFKNKCTDVSRELYLEHGWAMPKGLQNKAERDPFQLKNSEWQKLKRQGIDPRELKSIIQAAWQLSDNGESFKRALQDSGLFLAKGDKRGFVVVDHTEKVYSLSRHGGIKAKELKTRLGSPDDLPSIALTNVRIRNIYTKEMLGKVNSLKNQHKAQMRPYEEQKAALVKKQRAERREQQVRHRLKGKATMQDVRGRFRKGVMGFFDKVTGKSERLRLIGRKELNAVKAEHAESRHKMIFRHNRERAELQKQIHQNKERQLEERKQLAKTIQRLRAEQRAEQKYDSMRQGFEDSSMDQGRAQKKQDKDGQAINKARKHRRRREID